MARYVCDFDVVKGEAEKIISAASEMDASLSKYETDVSNHLSTWLGSSAKKAFEITDDEQFNTTRGHIKDIEEVGNFVKSAASLIESLEGALGGMNI